MRIVVCGAGGAIGGHLTKTLIQQGHLVRCVDIKPKSKWWQVHPEAENHGSVDLAIPRRAKEMVEGAQRVYDLADNMGGIGYISSHKVAGAESVEIGISLLRASALANVGRFFFSSSACIYPTYMQKITDDAPALKESDAWPAMPEEGYGASKLYIEQLMNHYNEECGLVTRIARYHNVYGPYGSWCDGREKAPAALCRKIVRAEMEKDYNIEVWGDGKQIRSYLYVSDCVAGTIALMESEYTKPLNLGSEFGISVDDLVALIEQIAGIHVEKHYVIDAAQGVRSRNADITFARQHLSWQPKVNLIEGLALLYAWIKEQSGASGAHNAPKAPTTAVPV
jgi:GDP-D-mannose 3',5'-epimerase